VEPQVHVEGKSKLEAAGFSVRVRILAASYRTRMITEPNAVAPTH
jgi:hypothetical protein